MFSRKKFLAWLTVFTVLFSAGWFANQSRANDNDDIYYKIDKGLFYLKEVFETVSRNYVDELNPETLSKSAIKGMLQEFDPYTVFFEDPGSQQMRMITRGKYGGVGMEIGMQNKKITVIAPMEETPAQRAGIRPGDVITKIDGEATRNMNLEDASQKLRGKIGSRVSIEIERPGVNQPFTVELTREEIVLKDVTYAAFLEPGTAYIRLAAFSDKAGKELRDAVSALQMQSPIERAILDLRGNPGGLLTSAVEVANVFLPPGQLVVSTRGVHESENKFFTKENPLLPVQPLVVLIDRSSASASEIVAGAIQDLDRGVLVGTQTFGKGLVQKVFPIDKVTQAYLKITTAKYYVPSGRSIQKEEYKKNNSVFTDLSDSVEYDPKIDYFTANGRVVHSGGGIQPDVAMPEAELDPFMQTLLARGLFFQFAVEYMSKNPGLKKSGMAAVDEPLLQEFEAYVLRQGLDFELEGEAELNKFLKIAREKKYSEDLRDLVEVALQKLDTRKRDEFAEHRQDIIRNLEAEFAEKLQDSEARTRVQLSHDPEVKRAVEVLHNMQQYQQILAINK
ncbi:MAG: PDZ domain-containing protein [Calditrichaceae bacterium]|nr:S41 family peptidase [Calditrichia bacterium]NUQ43448.1 PDZ domain-containing protein [Calditrichaceae bacterium]